MMRRRSFLRGVALFLAVLLLLVALSSCGVGSSSEHADIVCTIFPIYDWVMNLLGDLSEQYTVRLLSEGGTDLHSYQPSVGDIADISDSALFLYVGGASDTWVREVTQTNGTSLALLDVIDPCTEEHDHEQEHDHAHDHDAVDEHFWMSLRNAELAVSAIADALATLYDENASVFRQNAKAYTASLDALDARYREAVEAAERDTILVADRFPFSYLVKDYGISYHAAFSGCSTDTEASFSVVAALSEAITALDISVILITETGDTALAETLKQSTGNTDLEILVLHSCQSVTKAGIRDGTDYLSIMEENLSVLIRALAA